MSLFQLERGKNMKRIGKKMGRELIAQRALAIAKQIVESGSYKNAVAGIGRMMELGSACNFDEYWKEKRDIGRDKEADCLYDFERNGKLRDIMEIK